MQLEFDRARNMRNSKMHPEKHIITGVMGFTNGNAMLFVNVINKLFLDKEELLNISNTEEALRGKIKEFRDGQFILSFRNQKILAWKLYDIKYLKLKNFF